MLRILSKVLEKNLNNFFFLSYMKHNIKITSTLVLVFLLAQFVGLFIVNFYIEHDLPVQPPKVENKSLSFIPIVIGILIGTLLFLLLARFRKPFVLKIWFFATIWFTLYLSFNVFIKSTLATITALALAVYRMFKPNVIIHNFTEIFIYGGLSAFFVPIIK